MLAVQDAARSRRFAFFKPLSAVARRIGAAPEEAPTGAAAASGEFDPPTRDVGVDLCLRELMEPGGASVRAEYEAWRRRPGFGAVHEFVGGFSHRALYALSVADVEAACRRTEHALGDVSKGWLEAQPDYRAARDFDTPFAMQHLFHAFLERRGRLPLWQDVMPFLEREVPEYYVGPFREATGYASSPPPRRAVLDKGIRWRLGCAYYSFLREADVLVRLRRAHGVDARYHLLADVTFRVDLWVGNVIVSLFVSNGDFRTAQGGGRKTPVMRVFRDGADRFSFVDMPRPKPRKFGVVDLVPVEEVAALARRIEERL